MKCTVLGDMLGEQFSMVGAWTHGFNCASAPRLNSSVEALIPIVTIFGDRDFKEVINIK